MYQSFVASNCVSCEARHGQETSDCLDCMFMLRPGGPETFERAVVEHRSFCLLFFLSLPVLQPPLPFLCSCSHPSTPTRWRKHLFKLHPSIIFLPVNPIHPPVWGAFASHLLLVCALSLTCQNGARGPAGSGCWGARRKRHARPGFREAIRVTGGERQEIPRKADRPASQASRNTTSGTPIGSICREKKRRKDVEHLPAYQ